MKKFRKFKLYFFFFNLPYTWISIMKMVILTLIIPTEMISTQEMFKYVDDKYVP